MQDKLERRGSEFATEGSARGAASAPGKRANTDGPGPGAPGAADAPGKQAATETSGLAIARSATEGSTPGRVPAPVSSALERAQGAPLQQPETWSKRVGGDVSGARVVTAEGAPEAAASIDARAFTVGNRVFMGAGNDAHTDGGALLAHELTHVTQQQNAPAPSSWSELPFVEHGDQREVQARSHDGGAPGASGQAIARDAEPDLDAASYRKAFAKQIGDGIVAYLTAHDLPSGSRFVTFSGPMTSGLPIGPSIVAATGADLDAKLDGWLGAGKIKQLVDKARPMGREQVTDGKTTWTDDKMGDGPSRWFPDVATEIGAALHGLLRQSLDRIVPRYQSAAVAVATAAEEKAAASLAEPPRPQPSDIVSSAPIDVSTIAALCSRAHFDLAAYRTAYPKEKGKLGTLRPVTVSWEPPKNGSYWARVTAPADPTPEEVAHTLFGSSLQTSELVVLASPLFGFNGAWRLLPRHQDALRAMGVDLAKTGDAAKESVNGPLADEIAQNQGNQTASKAATKGDVLRTLDEDLAIITVIEKAGAAFGMGKNPMLPALAPLRTRITDRRAKLAVASEADALKWAGAVEAQQAVLSQVAFGFDREAKRLAELTKMVTDPAIKVGAFNLPPYVREAMLVVAMHYADVALLSDAPQTAAAKLVEVEDEAGALPVTFLEGTLASIQRALDDARNAKHDNAEHDSYNVGGMATREQQLKARLAALRGLIKTDPEAATKEIKELSRLIEELQVETEMVANMDQIDAVWKALDDGVSVWWSSLLTQVRARQLKSQGDEFHARWKAVFALWKSGDPGKQAQAKTQLDALRSDPELPKWLGDVQSLIKSAQIEKLIGQLVALIAITVVTMGVGDLVVAGAAGWELSAGATAVAAGGAEAATFTLLSQIFLDSDHSFGHVVYELGTNWAMFGVMRRFQMFAEIAKLSKIGSITGSTLILAASTYAKADLDKFIKEGRHLTPEEVRMIALQGMAMAIAMHAIAPMTKPFLKELEGSAYSFATRIKANNVTRETLTASAEALKGTRDFTQASEYVIQEKAWLEQRLKLLDEVEAQATKEAAEKPADGGIARKINMTPEQLSSLRTDLNANLAAVNEGTLPLTQLEPKAPGLFTCPRETIRDVVKALGEVQKTTVDPVTTAVSYEVKTSDGTIVTVMEKIDPAADWVAALKGRLSPAGVGNLEVELKSKTPAQVRDEFKGDLDSAAKKLGVGASGTSQDSLDLYGEGTIPSDRDARWKYKDDPAHWKPERRALHNELLTKAELDAQKFADAVEQTGAAPTVYAMRGNTAAGKTRAVTNNVPELAAPMAATKDLPYRSVNPDNFKPDLINASTGQGLTSQQVHPEASMLSDRMQLQLKDMKTSDGSQLGSVLIDKRLAGIGDVQAYITYAQSSGRKFVLYDVDAPLEVSLAGVLERVPGGADPLPPFQVVADGFKAVRDNRMDVLNLFLGKTDLSYQLYAAKPNGERVLVASVNNGTLTIADAVLFREATSAPGDAGQLLGSKPITEDAIASLVSGLDAARAQKVGNLLRRYIGWTWKAALDAHAAEQPPLTAAPSP